MTDDALFVLSVRLSVVAAFVALVLRQNPRLRTEIRLDLVWRWVRLRYVVGFAWRRRHFRRETAGHLRGRVPVESGVGVPPPPPPPRDLQVDTGKMQPLFGDAHITPEGYALIEEFWRAAGRAGFSAEDMHAAAGPMRRPKAERLRERSYIQRYGDGEILVLGDRCYQPPGRTPHGG